MFESFQQRNNNNRYEGRRGLIYVRVSSEQQRLYGHGPESQAIRCIQDLEHINVPHEETFSDSYTGGGDFMRRPAMRKLLAYVDANPHRKFVVIFDDLKRFARDKKFHWELRAAFRIRDVELRCLNYNFDDSPEGEFVETIFAAQNELERLQNRRQVIQKQEARLRGGYWPFSAKKGYSRVPNPYNDKKLILVPDNDGKILAEAFEAFASGALLRKIDVCKFLVEKGFWTKQRPEKYIEKATEMLSDCFYVGDIFYPKWNIERIKGNHEGIVSRATFERVQDRLNNPEVKKRVRNDITADFPSRGLVSCVCGGHLTAAWSKGRSALYGYYFCQNRACAHYRKSSLAKTIHDGFFDCLRSSALRPDALPLVETIYERVWKHRAANVAERQKLRAQRTTELEKEISDLAVMARNAQSDSVRRVYEGQIEKAALALAVERENTKETPDLAIPYRTALSTAIGFLKDPYSIWEKVDPREQRNLYFFVFDEKLTYDRNSGYRTAQIPTATRLFENFVDANTGTVEMRGQTLNLLMDYLARFWAYYQSSPMFQHALERNRPTKRFDVDKAA